MLVLSRKKNESIVINNDITIVVVEIRGDKVRLGVEAPKHIPVHRYEVQKAIEHNEKQTGEAETTVTPIADVNLKTGEVTQLNDFQTLPANPEAVIQT